MLMISSLKKNKIKARMVELGMNQSNLAEKMGISKVTLSKKLNSTAKIYLEDVAKFVEILKLSPVQTHEYFFDLKSVNSETK